MDFELRTGKMSFLEFYQKNTLFGKTKFSMFHYSSRVIDEPKMSEIRILNLCHKKTILVDIYRQSLLIPAFVCVILILFFTHFKCVVGWILENDKSSMNEHLGVQKEILVNLSYVF